MSLTVLRKARRTALTLLALAVAPGLGGCFDPEDGRPRGGGHGGDARNVPAAGIHPPSKIDSSKDLSLLQQDGPRPGARPAGPPPAPRRRPATEPPPVEAAPGVRSTLLRRVGEPAPLPTAPPR